MNRAFNSPDECAAMAAAGQEALDSRFTKAQWLDKMATIYWKMGFR